MIELRQANSLLNIPRVVWYKKADETPGLILMEYLSSAQGVSGFDEMLGRGLAQLHQKSASAFGLAFSNYCGITVQDNTWTGNWPDFFAKRRIGALVSLLKQKRGLAPEEQKIYEKLIERLPALIPDNKKPSLIHGDLWSGNYMYTIKGPALIDPACYYAEREMELGMMKLFGGFSDAVWKSYQEEFPLDPEWESRIKLYQLYHVLNHYLLFGGSYGRQAVDIAKAYL
jgi:fructosamine-3-kinase